MTILTSQYSIYTADALAGRDVNFSRDRDTSRTYVSENSIIIDTLKLSKLLPALPSTYVNIILLPYDKMNTNEGFNARLKSMPYMLLFIRVGHV